ncbi:EAL domain-containing protein [Psychromonas antarctica]|uniref:bifunctional diguanylate cyclase/phosphodiesterase n=1 Tax=Psychromonas antarctica TaxID=67573 RepID=UPI001EE87530|nr:EAL domain-containing protein [Psychromonas antarctica]MCG6200422.1 EAL domain-containing protein [Psychromonas antarctica]
MLHLKQNIWLLFYFLVFLGGVLLATDIHIKNKEILNEVKSEQLYLTKIYHRHLNSLFTEHEILNDLIANEYMQNPKNTRETFARVLALKPLLLDIAIFSKEGELMLSALNPSLPNLLENSNTQQWFQESLDTNGMVIGKAYFILDLNKWVLPMRTKIVDDRGNTVAVISTGIDLAELHQRWFQENHHKNTIQATLNNGALRIFRNNLTTQQYANYYNKPLPNKKIFNQRLSQLKTRLNTNTTTDSTPFIQDISASGTTGLLYTITYNKRFRLWISAEIPYQLVLQKLSQHIFFAVVFYLLFILIIFSFFRWIAKIEKSKLNELTYKAEHDALTGLANSTVMKKYFRQLQCTTEKPLALLYLDLDHFKNINDTFGHSYGDLILIEVAKRLTQSLAHHKGLATRYSGDEFVIFVESNNKAEISAYATFLLKSISLPYLIKQDVFRIRASIGIACFPDDASNIESLLSYADSSMFMAKKQKNQCLFFSKSVHHQLIHNIEIEQALHHAIINDEISLVYQPQLDRNQALFGVEALVRWNNKKLGNIPPDLFIPIAEEIGLMPKLGLYIMHKAMQEIASLQAREALQFKLSINVSVRQFVQIDFIEKLMDACKKYTGGQIAITIEITESLFIESLDDLLPTFYKMKDNYISLSLDDFGTGYSSLSMLKKLPIDELKIDKSFVDNIADNSNDRAMVKSIISMGKNLGLLVLAEGVEHKEQVEILKKSGCDIFQGYYFSKPLSLKDLETFAKINKATHHLPRKFGHLPDQSQ